MNGVCPQCLKIFSSSLVLTINLLEMGRTVKPDSDIIIDLMVHYLH